MLTTLPITNESVARGYVHRTLREASERRAAALQKADAAFRPSRWRRGPVFRAWVQFMDTALEERVLRRELEGSGKGARALWLFWEVAGEGERFHINAALLDGRNLRVREGELLRVSRHAVQRLFQRLRTTDATYALSELVAAAEQAAHLRAKALRHGECYRVHLQVPTNQGEAVMVWDDQANNFLVKTWIHRDGLNERRTLRRDEALRRGDRICV